MSNLFVTVFTPVHSSLGKCDQIDALPHWYQLNANISSLLGIESLRLHPVLAAVKIEVPPLSSSGTLPSGGRSQGTGGDRLVHASWPVSFRPCVWTKGGRWRGGSLVSGWWAWVVYVCSVWCVCVCVWEREGEEKRWRNRGWQERETEQDGTADGDGMWQFSLGLCD